jgi:hypothetical protein
MVRKFVLAAALIVASSAAIAQGSTSKTPENKATADGQGTPQEQAACRPDVRRFCRDLKPDAGSLSFLSCLQGHREKLSRACLAVLESHGQ